MKSPPNIHRSRTKPQSENTPLIRSALRDPVADEHDGDDLPLATAHRLAPVPLRSVSIAGFTLVELLAVVAIMGLLVTIGIAGYSQMRKSLGVGTAARHVAERLEMARQAAVTSSVRSRYYVDAANNQDAVLKEVLGLRSPTGNTYYQYVIAAGQLPTGVTFLTTGLPSLRTPLSSLGFTQYGTYNRPALTTGYDTVTGNWILLTNAFSSIGGSDRWEPNGPTIEFSPEGRPAQTYTVTVARMSYTQECAYVIVDGLTGRIRTVRQ